MSITPSLVYPLLLRAASPVAEAAMHVASANAAAKKALTSTCAGTSWVLVQRQSGFDVQWYLATLKEVTDALERASETSKTLWSALKLGEHQRVATVQLNAMGSAFAGARVVLDGMRFIGLIEPMGEATRAMTDGPAAPTMGAGMGAGAAPPAPAARSQTTNPDEFTRMFGAPVTQPVETTPPEPMPGAAPMVAAPTPTAAFPTSKSAVVRGGSEMGGRTMAVDERAAPDADANAPATVAPLHASAYINAPRRTQPGKKILLELGLASAPTQGVEGGNIVIHFPINAPDITLDIHIECAGFTCDKGFDQQLTITQRDPFTPRIKLFLGVAPLADGVDEELRAIQLFYSHAGLACGSATWRVLVQRTDVAVELPSGASIKPLVAIAPSAPAIDVTFRIAFQDDNEATHTLRWSFTSPHDVSQPVGKMVRSSTELASLPIGIVDEVAQGDGLPGIELLMEGIGVSITNEIPGGVWEVLAHVKQCVQAARGNTAIPTVLLLTQETRVPWELALVPDSLADTARPKFLNTQFIVTRWLLDDNIPAMPPYVAKARDVVALYGDYSQSNVGELPFAKREADALCAHHGTAFTASRENVLNVLLNRAMQPGGVPLSPRVVHFAGHGEAARASTAASFLMLNDGTTLSMTYFLNAPSLRTNQPLVFLNACQVGAGTTSLGQPGGFAGFCVRAGCSAVIAPLWSVNDEVAFTVAQEFYDDILASSDALSIAESMHKNRLKPYSDISAADANGTVTTRTTATRLAYLVYGHPAFHP